MTMQATTVPPSPARDETPARATESGTRRFAERLARVFASDFFRATSLGITSSSIGVGTYLGESTDEDDAAYGEAVAHALRSGVNLIDTAINYRGQRSERAVCSALKRVFDSRDVARDEAIVCTKGGYIPLGETPPASREEYQAYVQREFIDQEILRSDEIVAGGHSLAPRFLRYCIAKSRQNLGLRTIDLYYVHNPEQQLSSQGADVLRTRLRAAFTVLEE